MIQKISALDVAFEKDALLEGLAKAIPQRFERTRALVGGDLVSAGRAALSAGTARSDAALLAKHTGETIEHLPNRRQAFMGDMFKQEAGKQQDALTAAHGRLQASGIVDKPLDMRSPMTLAPHAAPANMAQAHHQVAAARTPSPPSKSQGLLGQAGDLDLSKYHPSMLLGGAGLVGGAAASENPEDLPRNLAVGAGAGVLGGMGLRQLKHASLNPTMNIGPLGMGIRPDTERLPGTYRSVPTSVIQRVGEGMDQGMSPDEAVQHGAAAPEIGTAPVMGTVLGATAGHYLGGGMKGLLLGGALGYGAGALAKGQMQKQYQQDARTALQGLAIERARMGIR